MPTTPATAARLLAAVLATAALFLAGAVPAGAEQDAKNPDVGGALDRQGVVLNGQPTPLPAGNVKSFVVSDLDTGEILAASNAHLPLPPASTLKMLTALTVLPRINLDAIYTAVDQDAAVDGSKVGIVPGSTYTARQLMEGLFLISGNDAANAVANLNGGLKTTLRQMQAEAWRVHAYDTVPSTASGLDAPGQVTTAYDLALIARAGMARRDFARFAGTVNSTFPTAGTDDPTTRATFEIWNQNDLLNGGFEGAIGVKSGFTTQAGRTFAAAAERGGKRYLVTLMGIEGNTYSTGAAYLEWAFANAEALRPVATLPEPKYDISQTDAAQLISADGTPVTPVAATQSAPESATLADPAASASGPGLFAKSVPFILGITIACCLLLWLGLRRQHRRALRMRNPATRSVVDLRDPAKVGV